MAHSPSPFLILAAVSLAGLACGKDSPSGRTNPPASAIAPQAVTTDAAQVIAPPEPTIAVAEQEEEAPPEVLEEIQNPMRFVGLQKGRALDVRKCPRGAVCISWSDLAVVIYADAKSYYFIEAVRDPAISYGSPTSARRRVEAAVRAVLAKYYRTKRALLSCHVAGRLSGLSGFAEYLTAPVPTAAKVSPPAALTPTQAQELVAQGVAKASPGSRPYENFSATEIGQMTADTFKSPRLLFGSNILNSRNAKASISEFVFVFSPESRRVYALDRSIYDVPEAVLSERSMEKRAVELDKELIKLLVALGVEKVGVPSARLCELPILSGIQHWVPVLEEE